MNLEIINRNLYGCYYRSMVDLDLVHLRFSITSRKILNVLRNVGDMYRDSV